MNALTGETPLVVGTGNDRREFVLVLDHEALIEAEGAYRKPLPMLMADATLGFFGASRAMLFGALRAHHPEMSLADATSLFLEHTKEVSKALEVAAKAAYPDAPAGEGKKGQRPPAKPRAGKSSGGSGVKRGSTRKRSSAPPRGSSKSSLAAG